MGESFSSVEQSFFLVGEQLADLPLATDDEPKRWWHRLLYNRWTPTACELAEDVDDYYATYELEGTAAFELAA